MHLYDRLDAWPAALRNALIGVTGGLLIGMTLGFPFLRWSDLTYDLSIFGVVGLNLGLWWVIGAVVASPKTRSGLDDATVRHRGLMAGAWLREAKSTRMSEIDATFSLVAWSERIGRALEEHLAASVGPIHIRQVDDTQLTAHALIHDKEQTEWVEATLTHDAADFVCLRTVPIAASTIEIDPDWPAARRALLARAEALDADGFDVLFVQVNAEIDRLAAADATSRSSSPYLTPAGARALGFWAEGPGVPPGGPDAAWLLVEEDAWHERIEVQCGLRVLGLCRAAGQADAPWQLWRLRRGA
ncbi:MAG: hypothetical protein AAGA48_06920 [Myxococcota bacterium]